jgi:pimeloyl-ACP methyl ester carboxylesterase
MIMIGSADKSMAGEPTQDTVVILHGIGHTRWNMHGIEKAMRRQGYATLNITYPSLRKDIPHLADFVNKKLENEKIWNKPGQVHFVTHSMGGLVIRAYLERYKTEISHAKMGRVVMIAPPNGGSEVADFLRDFPPYKWIYGPAGQELTTAAQSMNAVEPWYEVGIIAGNRGWPYPVANTLIDGAHDGRVSVERTKLVGMKAHITISATHSLISWDKDVYTQSVHFLKNGTFDHAK